MEPKRLGIIILATQAMLAQMLCQSWLDAEPSEPENPQGLGLVLQPDTCDGAEWEGGCYH